MSRRRNSSLFLGAVGLCIATSASAAVSVDEAKKLGGGELTEWGAIRAGNKEGTIPAYTGEKITPPASYNPANPSYVPDPWGDKPQFTITAQNMAQYADKLTAGQKAMFQTFPSFRMNVYKTHRVTQFPKYILDNTAKNATSCKAVDGGMRLEGCYGGVLFPIPQNGYEAMWNHLVHFQGVALSGVQESWLVDASGGHILQGHQNVVYHFPIWDPANKEPGKPQDYYWKLRYETDAPARRNGEKYIFLFPLDPTRGTRVYAYIAGQRRVKLAPDLAYDTPSPVSGGAETIDESAVYFGAMDRYDMKYLGKRETFLWVNSNISDDVKVCPPEKILQKNFANPECVRWELHRVDVVEATLKPGFRHILPHRMFYLDEDKTGAATADAYDAAGKLYRFDNAPHYNIYDEKGNLTNNSQNGSTSDFLTGMYFLAGHIGCTGCGLLPSYNPKPSTYYSPEALAGEGIR